MRDRLLDASFSELALALAMDYESIYVIDSTDDSYVEYSTTGSGNEMTIRSSGENFYDDTIYNCHKLVWPEDQGIFLKSLKKERLMDALANGDSFSLRYRLSVDNQPQYYFLKTIRSTSEDIIIGVRNVDAQTRRDNKEYADYKLFGDIAKSLGSMYEVIYYVDIETGKYTEFYTSENYSELGIYNDGGDFFENVKTDIEKHIYQDDREKLMDELDKNNLLSTLEKSKSHSIVYRQIQDDALLYMNLIAFKRHKESNHIVVAVQNIDKQVRHEESITEEGEAFTQIAMALAQRYEIIYCVDLKTDEYIEISKKVEYTKLKDDAKGSDFFGMAQRHMTKDIYPEDYPQMAEAMKRENILADLKESGKLFLNYRLMLDGRPQYMTLFAVRAKSNPDKLIIAIANVDSAKQRELEFEDAVGSAMNIANHDPLTRLKNKRSYAQSEIRLDGAIHEMVQTPFAIVVCDINGLKEVNDTKGHKAGDDYILAASEILRSVFSGCDIYRLGGDEFAIFLEDSKYEERHLLLKKLANIMVANRKNNDVTLAYGMSEYKPNEDLRVQDVFERADKAMYVNKNSVRGFMKGEGDFHTDHFLKITSDDESMKFYALFSELVLVITSMNKNVVEKTPAIEKILVEMATMFRLSKAVTHIYKSPQDEEQGTGESICSFDKGIDDRIILSYRIPSSVSIIAVMDVYMSPDEKPLSDEERWRIELVMRITLSYIVSNRMRSKTSELAFHDDRGFNNQRNFMKYLANHREELGNMVAFRYNLLHFALVNQELGRKRGDIVIKSHYQTLSDMIGKDGMVATLGGDNFIGICTNQMMGNVFTFLSDASIVHDTISGKTVNVSTSVGVYRIPRDYHDVSPDDIMERINIAYQVAKSGQQDRIVFFEKSQIAEREKIVRIQRLFPQALRDEEFKVYYQPKVHTETGRLIGAEALCRWFHDDQMISPGDFIPVLEQTEDICKLDFYMLEHVCRDIRRWLDEGMKVVRVSVNLSRKHMTDHKLVDDILKVIDRHNIPHSCIEIELTETTSDVEFNDLKRVVKGLQSVGIFTSVDDFGVGYSSINLIRELPWNVLKVDRSLLPDEGDDPDSVNSVMFRHVISMVNDLGIECIVEGVETEDQLQLLRDNKCLYAQGFLFDRPLPVREFESRMLAEYYQMNS